MKGFLRVLLEYVRIFFVVYWVFELKLISMDFRIPSPSLGRARSGLLNIGWMLKKKQEDRSK